MTSDTSTQTMREWTEFADGPLVFPSARATYTTRTGAP